MPISREDFEEILCACVRKSVRTRSGNERVIDLNHLEQILDRYAKAKPQLTVERVAGIIRNRMNRCMSESKFAIQAELIDLLKEINEAENDTRK